MLSAGDESRFGFTVSKRGYEMSEVNEFLESMLKDWDTKLSAANKRITDLEGDLATANQQEEAVRLTLIAATKTKDELVGKAQRQLDEASTNAREEAEKILADARYEAFRLITDAKENSEAALTEAVADAARKMADAEREAEDTLSAARREAITIVSQIQEESARMLAEREAELAKQAEQYEEENVELTERVIKLRAVTTDLATRLDALARGKIEELFAMSGLIETTIDQDNHLTQMVRQGTALSSNAFTEEDSEEEAPRGSFYTRRSAGLPRIGPEAAEGVRAAVSAMRTRAIEAADPNERHDPEEQPLAMQSA